jgi:hypothetical protein
VASYILPFALHAPSSGWHPSPPPDFAESCSARRGSLMPESDMVETRSVVIEPPRRWEAMNLREIWAYRELLYFLTWRDVKVRYKQTAIGAAWAVLQPLLTMVVFSVIFGALIRVPSDGLP